MEDLPVCAVVLVAAAVIAAVVTDVTFSSVVPRARVCCSS